MAEVEVIDQAGRVVARGEISPDNEIVPPEGEPGWPVLLDAEPPLTVLWPDGQRKALAYPRAVRAGNWLRGNATDG